ncbi:MAG: thiamine pyrophosphate-dependent enzyme [Candidatus Promineifilaceae bacterium]|nr:thiamine pyrophosphate-dependent enzyme [Candidatus Promineifilaceae bacterium]
MTTPVEIPTYSRKDFVSDQEVRWCPGCGDYAILAQVQKVMPEIGYRKEDIVFISGIGCSSRFPYYMNTYGMHSIHGRAPTIATGLAIANPELSVWVVTGDGDGLSIGGNHLLHACRRNVNLNIILFNNRIYGLTKGQYSPTSRKGHKTKSSPMGSIEQPLNPISVALAAEATFVARTMDNNVRHLAEMLTLASQHDGVSFVEVYQNCVIFNPSEWDDLSDRRTRADQMLFLEHGQPMVFGKTGDKGIVLRNGFQPEVVDLGNGISEDDLLVHNAESDQLAYLLSRLDHPVPMGVIRDVSRPTYTEGLMGQVAEAQTKKGVGELNELYRQADLWEVTGGEQVTSQVAGQVSSELDEEYVDRLDDLVEEDQEAPLPVQDVMETAIIAALDPKSPISVEPKTSVANAIRQMNSHNIGCVLVNDKAGRLAGILTEADVVRKIACQVEDLSQVGVEEFMTPQPLALQAHMSIKQALHLMSAHGFRHLPLVDDDYHPEGIISFRDVVRFLKEDVVS